MSDEKEVYHLYAPQDETADTEASRAIADQYGNVIDEAYSTKDESSHLDEKIDEHIDNKNNPHLVTKAQLGLGNVDNTSDLNKPVSIPIQTALNDKVDKIAGKGLSTNDFSNVDKSKLSGIEADAQVNILEGVKVNGADLTITDKKVNVDLSSYYTKTESDNKYAILSGVNHFRDHNYFDYTLSCYPTSSLNNVILDFTTGQLHKNTSTSLFFRTQTTFYLTIGDSALNPHNYYISKTDFSTMKDCDLGSINYKWHNLYLSGNLSDGTNSTTVADIVANQPKVISITYSELKTLRDNAQLIPGMRYRITDYVTTTTEINSVANQSTSSASHQFDVIVVALTQNSFSEIASATLHEGDTYFAKNDLSAWKLWYCLDNDVSRFIWADTNGISLDNDILYLRVPKYDKIGDAYPYAWINRASILRYTSTETPDLTNSAYSSSTGGTAYVINAIHEAQGKGVIYRMIDEFGNDCPYDFKNILFTDRTSGRMYSNAYTFSELNPNDMTLTDATIDIMASIASHTSSSLESGTYNNIIKPHYHNQRQSLNFIVFISGSSTQYRLNATDNFFDFNCNTIRLERWSHGNRFGCFCNHINTNWYAEYNEFGEKCSDITMAVYCSNNSFHDNVKQIDFGISCRFNIIKSHCTRIRFGDANGVIDYCYYNIIDEKCQDLYINSTNTTASDSNRLQYVHVHSFTIGAYPARTTITIPDRALTYETNVYPSGSVDIFA